MYNDYFFRILFARFALITKNSFKVIGKEKKIIELKEVP